jgi:AraC-like DNA-binding protein
VDDQSHIILGPPFHRHFCGVGGYSIKAYVGGRVLFRVERRLFAVDDDAYLLVNDGQEYEFRTPAESSLFNFTIFASKADVADGWSSLGRSELELLDDPHRRDAAAPEFFTTPLRATAELREIRGKLRELAIARALTPDALGAVTSELLTHALQAQWVANGQVRRVRAVRRSTREEAVRRVRRAIDAIDADVARQLDLDMLCAIACMAKHHFLRRFKSVTGETPHQYLLGRRMTRARELLLASDLSAAEIGRRCGFDKPSTFSSAFRGIHGLPPDEWRRRQCSANDR